MSSVFPRKLSILRRGVGGALNFTKNVPKLHEIKEHLVASSRPSPQPDVPLPSAVADPGFSQGGRQPSEQGGAGTKSNFFP